LRPGAVRRTRRRGVVNIDPTIRIMQVREIEGTTLTK